MRQQNTTVDGGNVGGANAVSFEGASLTLCVK